MTTISALEYIAFCQNNTAVLNVGKEGDKDQTEKVEGISLIMALFSLFFCAMSQILSRLD